MVEISELLDLSKTIAAKLFDGKTYPWEVLDDIKAFILELGPTLPADEFDNPAEGVFPHFAQQAHIIPQQFQRKAGIGHTAPCMNTGCLHTDQFARHQQIADPVIAVSGGEDRGHIQADMPGGNNLFHTEQTFQKQPAACVPHQGYLQPAG